MQQGFRVVPARHCYHKSLTPLMEEVREQLSTGPVYISFDIDALDPSFAPGTGLGISNDGLKEHIILHKKQQQPFYGLCPGLPGEPVPKETFTHPPSWSSSNLCQLPSTTIHSILPVQIMCSAIFLHNLSLCTLVYLLVWSPLPHTPYISSPNQCLLFVTHAHTIAPCFAVVSRLYYLFLVFLSTPSLELYLLP